MNEIMYRDKQGWEALCVCVGGGDINQLGCPVYKEK